MDIASHGECALWTIPSFTPCGQPLMFDVRRGIPLFSTWHRNALISTCVVSPRRNASFVCSTMNFLGWWNCSFRHPVYRRLYRISTRSTVFDGFFVQFSRNRLVRSAAFSEKVHVRFLIVRELYVFDVPCRQVVNWINFLLAISSWFQQCVGCLLLLTGLVSEIKVEIE